MREWKIDNKLIQKINRFIFYTVQTINMESKFLFSNQLTLLISHQIQRQEMFN